ncbi:energy transducer TonB [Flavobacterium sp. K77]|uniref:energy transducer TonB n=1 Tax=Flavobacterium sp. K77 TaxID=2910676 RepID=UPI001F2F9906|nr:energy transducer TonB [Flavobacterium sp. K77]MCF6140430.1 energy transducer TonB [Flavobacterium sp. K77]
MGKFLMLILLCFSQVIFSQSKEVKKKADDFRDNLKNYNEEEIILDENHIYNLAGLEILPSFPEGIVKFRNFLSKIYKKPHKQPALIVKIFATFVIEKDGTLSDIKIVYDIGFGTGQELLRVLKLSPKWIPGKQNNKKVRSLYSLVFTLPN